MPLPSFVCCAISLLNDAGFDAYVVGGCVRDRLMGKQPLDWDITTSARPEETLAVFDSYRTITTGLQHGTITVLIEGVPLEITTYRVDGNYSDGRHPDFVTFTPSLVEDLRRRDFTINAMAYHPVKGLVDPFDGQEDIQNRTIRCVGNPMERFAEDALRILRGLRFASTLGFHLEEQTAQAIHLLAPSLWQVSVERISTELKRLICGAAAADIFSEYEDVIAVFLPEIQRALHGNRLSALPSEPMVRLAVLFHDAEVDAHDAECALRRLHWDNQTIRGVAQLLSVNIPVVQNKDGYLLRLLNCLGPELIWHYFRLNETDDTLVQRTQELLSENVCYKVSMLAMNGSDLEALGIASGPALGALLKELLYAVMDGACSNTKESLTEYIHNHKKPVQ